jgi:hypothetical protein
MYLADGSNKKMSYFYVSNMVAVGGLMKVQLSERDFLGLESFFMVLKQQSVFSGRLFYSRRKINKKEGWGVALIIQSLGINFQSSKPTKGTETYFGPFLEF